MLFCRRALALFFVGSMPFVAVAQTDDTPPARVHIELNNLQDIDGSCRLSFLAKNETAVAIDKAVFETVIFDTNGGVASLSLFDFRDLPVERARVRQFDLPGRSCDSIGQALINGANTCVVDGADNAICTNNLFLSSRLSVGLIG